MGSKQLENWTRHADVCGGASGSEFSDTLPEIVEGVDLLFDPHRKTYALRYEDSPSPETLTHCLYDLVMPHLIAHDGNFVLHCGVVNTNNGALGFIGPSGQGKSTITASLHQFGLTLISDDAVVLHKNDPGYHVERLHPSLRLFPDSIDRLFSKDNETAPMADYSDKRHVSFAPGPETAALHCLFRLSDPSDAISITRLSFNDACMALVSNSFALNPSDPTEAKRRFIAAADVAHVVPVYDLAYPRTYEILPKVHAEILELAGLAEHESAPA